MDVGDLEWVVPHQASGRIIEAVRARMTGTGAIVINEVGERGNTSSSTIPLALPHALKLAQPGGRSLGKPSLTPSVSVGAW